MIYLSFELIWIIKDLQNFLSYFLNWLIRVNSYDSSSIFFEIFNHFVALFIKNTDSLVNMLYIVYRITALLAFLLESLFHLAICAFKV